MESNDRQAQHFLDLIKRSRRGRFKVYIGMSAGVGKTYRMLQEAHALLQSGIDVWVGYVETHQRKETHALLEGLSVVPRRKLFYKGKELEEMDVQAIIALQPELVIVDELAHTNIEGSKNEKRWQDVIEILEAGINVISAVNIQHLESLNEAVKAITGVEVQERVPDKFLQMANEVVNIDLTADELITRLKSGKIYDFPAHNEVITRRTASFAAVWLIFGLFGTIGAFPLFWVIAGIMAVYFVLGLKWLVSRIWLAALFAFLDPMVFAIGTGLMVVDVERFP